MSSIKSMVGHSLGAIGSIEIAACALAIENNVVPPTANLHEPDPECDLDYVPLVARETPLDALTVGSGFGGFQSAMILTEGNMTAHRPRSEQRQPAARGGRDRHRRDGPVASAGGVLGIGPRGHSSIGPVTRFDAERLPGGLAGEVPEFQVEEHLPSRLIPRRTGSHVSRSPLRVALHDAGHEKETSRSTTPE